MRIDLKQNSILSQFSDEEKTDFLALVSSQIDEALDVLQDVNSEKAPIVHRLKGGLSYFLEDEVVAQLKSYELKLKSNEISSNEEQDLIDLIKSIHLKIEEIR